MKILDHVFQLSGYTDTSHFVNSAFHPNNLQLSATMSLILSATAYYFHSFFGISLPVGVALLILFLMELFTGIKASKKEGEKFKSEKFGKGWFKLFIYAMMISCSWLLSKHVPVKPFFGWKFNVYDYLHYAFYNFVLLQLIISNLENFKRLGWDEYMPILSKITSFLKLKSKKNEND
jgi:hypothetical protein